MKYTILNFTILKYKLTMKNYIVTAVCLLWLSCSFLACTKKADENKPAERAATAKVDGFVFVGNVAANASLLSFTFSDNRIDTLWQNKKEQVSYYSQFNNSQRSFFITTTEQVKKGVFPQVKDISLYFISQGKSSVRKVKNFGNGLQFFAYWQDSNSVKLIINAIDPTTASYVEQKSLVVSWEGQQLFEEKKVYDLTKEGYPRLPQLPLEFSSSYSGASILSGQQNEIRVKMHNGQSDEIASASKFRISQIAWSENARWVFLTTGFIHPDNATLYSANPQTAKLYVFDLEKRMLLFSKASGGFLHIRQVNGLLLFDEGFGEKSMIRIYNPETNKIIHEIKINGGCGLTNIPQIPDYEA